MASSRPLKVLGIITARGESKRVPGKNIRPLNQRPLICYTIESARQASKLSRTIVSTDHAGIAEICQAAGAEVPFLRPPELAQDDTPHKPVLLHAIKWLYENDRYSSDMVVILKPTTPFRTAETIDRGVEMLQDSGADSVRTVTRVEGVHHPYWMFKRDLQNRAEPCIEGLSLDEYYQRQLLPPVYRLNGVVDVVRTDVLLNHQKAYGDDMRIMEIPERLALDIDTELDFKLCEVLMKEAAGADR